MNGEKIVFFVQRWMSGGMEGVITEIVTNFPNNKNICEIVTVQKEESIYDNKLKNNNINIKNLNSKIIKNPLVRNIIAFKKYIKYIKNNENIVLHINIYNAISNFYVLLTPKKNVKKIIIHAHNNGFDNDKYKIKWILNEIAKRIFNTKNCTKIACSHDAADFCFSLKDLREVKIVNNGINLEKFHYDFELRCNKRQEFSLKDKFIVGNIGRLVPQKNQLRLIDIFKEIVNIRENAELIIIGDGILEEEINKKIESYNLVDKVRLYKRRDDINEMLNVMDCFVFPSVYEGFGIVSIEAQATGLPTFISKGLPKEIFASKQAVEIDLKDSDINIAKLICSYDYSNRKSNELNEFSIKEMAKKIYELYELN